MKRRRKKQGNAAPTAEVTRVFKSGMSEEKTANGVSKSFASVAADIGEPDPENPQVVA
jgi:hypothetical protein